MTRLMGHNMMRKDGDAHMAERSIFFPAVSPKAVRAHWRAEFQAHADRILDEISGAGRADLLAAVRAAAVGRVPQVASPG